MWNMGKNRNPRKHEVVNPQTHLRVKNRFDGLVEESLKAPIQPITNRCSNKNNTILMTTLKQKNIAIIITTNI